MSTFWVRKGTQYIVVLFVTVALNFALPRLMPGTPLMYLAGEDVGLLPPEARAEILARHGLDQPLWVQFGRYLGQLARGDLGYSYQQRRPITRIVAERLPWTILLTGLSLALSTIIGVVFGTLSAWRRGHRTDVRTLATFIFLDSMPAFWLGMILVAVFAARLRWFPVFGAVTPNADLAGMALLVDVLRHLALPLATLTLVTISGVFLTMRYSMLEVLGEQYITVARAKGLPETQVIYRHALRNALLPVITVFMLSLGFLVSGATVVETVFAWPGIGRLMYEAVLRRDYPVMQATFLMITLSVIVANLVADLLYPLADPRVRQETT